MADSIVVSILGVTVTAAGLAFGLYQYRKNSEQASLTRRRERAVMATDQTKQFFSDDGVRFVMKVLDYGSVPSPTRPNQTFDVHQIPEALKIHWKDAPTETKEPISPEYVAIRTAFDDFLIWLERIEYLIKSDIVSEEGFGDLFSYWLVLLGEKPQPQDKVAHLSDAARKAIWSYIRSYQYNSVVQLFARYGRVGENGFVLRIQGQAHPPESAAPAQ
ncbi:hypothetical protein S58_34760 [Bradyrhizobium oligotrophicum S58]|uniref:Uncharacterized protein n=1 Tax=Bradyrhizobium oligotrophicum S58 TaxID=1245469 RepID=M4Z7G0_9BRAD|nr:MULTISPECIES: hypothetical protein [Bradyrhizobium]BAM89469.1 hypothetical protein S58_34760 [Bradyrhizobium oligotrophicum S58]